MFDKVLDDLKDCERDLQEIVDDKEIEEWVSFMLRSVIYTIQKTQKNIREITDDCVRKDDDDDDGIIIW
jgi:3-phenylpropionate/cinnamic acid dioxygenase small subunit